MSRLERHLCLVIKDDGLQSLEKGGLSITICSKTTKIAKIALSSQLQYKLRCFHSASTLNRFVVIQTEEIATKQ